MFNKCFVFAVAVLLRRAVPAIPAELLVSDRAENRILRYDSDTGSFLGELIGPATPRSVSDLDDPAAMALGDEGVLFVASRGNGKVLQFDASTGAFLGDFATGINGPSGLLVDPDRNQLLVSELGNFDGELVQRFDMATGESLGALAAGTGPAGRTDLAFGPDGMLYVGSFFDGRVLRFDPETGAPRPSAPGDETATFAGPVDEFLGTNGLAFFEDRLLAVGLFSFNVFQFDRADGSSVGELVPAEGGRLFFPADLLIDRDGSLLVSSLGNDDPSNGLPLGAGYIGKYDPRTGQATNPFFIADFIAGAGGLIQPSAMLLLPNALMPGDADQDFDFDQFDLVQVQIAGKYMTSEPATWGEGDWDGAPGGSPGNPPSGDGQFDARDIVAALAAGKYATGPYAAVMRVDESESSVFSNALGGSLALVGFGEATEGASKSAGLQADVNRFGSPAGTGPLHFGGQGYVPVPEPSTYLLLLVGLLFAWMAGGRGVTKAGGYQSFLPRR